MKLNHLMALPLDTECETMTTGFQHLDHLTGGLRIGQLCTIAARSGMGKTAFAVSLLRNIGVVQKVPTAYFSSMVMFVYRPEYYYFDTFEDMTPAENMADIMVGKNIFGGTGDVRMHFDNHVNFREI